MGAADRVSIDRDVAHVTCLGCGCSCDDIHVIVRSGRIAEAAHACALGVEWFGDGVVPQRSIHAGRDVSVEAAVKAGGELLARANRPLVYLATDISWETQREAVALADALHARLDTVTSATARESILAAQEYGRASATLGEIRNRADVVVFWGVDPALHYPRYSSRYALEPAGMHVPAGRRSRTVVAVDIDGVPNGRGPEDADRRVRVTAADEVATLTAIAAIASGRVTNGRASTSQTPPWRVARELAPILVAARYAVIVADAERDHAAGAPRDPARASALVVLAQTLNGPTRGALSTLRAGGNRSGADAVLTWQTGYPIAMDFGRGYPRYRPHDGTASACLARGDVDALAIVGAPASLTADLRAAMSGVASVVIGPRASESVFAERGIAIDTGVAGIHEDGTAVRMDEVPLDLRSVLPGPRAAAPLVRALREASSR
jgi:formylmethanofuran dehydrogenase subunit B